MSNILYIFLSCQYCNLWARNCGMKWMALQIYIMEWKIARPFIWDGPEVWNHNIDNSFQKNKNMDVKITSIVRSITFCAKKSFVITIHGVESGPKTRVWLFPGKVWLCKYHQSHFIWSYIEGDLNVIPKVLLSHKITSNPIYLIFLTDFMKTKYRVIQIKLPFFFCRRINSLHPSNW